MGKIELVIEILILILLLYVIFLKNYFQEKGKNLATKEDIGKITTEIEKVKTEISFKNQKDSDLFFERKKSLIHFYESYFLWTEDALKVSDIVLAHHNNSITLRERINYIKEIQNEVFKYYSRMIIYIDDKKFNQTITEIYNNSLPLHNKVNSLLLTLEDSSIKHKDLKERLNKSVSDSSAKVIKKDFEKIMKERDEAFENFNSNYDEIKVDISKNQKRLVHVYKKRIFEDYALTHNIG